MVGEQITAFDIDEYIDKKKVAELEEANKNKKKKKGFSHAKPKIKLFKFPNNQYMLTTYSKGNAIGVAPKFVQPFLVSNEPIANTSYKGAGSKQGNITSFLIEGSLSDIELARRAARVNKCLEIIDVKPNQSAEIDTQFNVQSRYILSDDLVPIFIDATRQDIKKHGAGKEAKKIISIDDHFVSINKINPNKILKPFESIAVVKSGKGKGEEICQLDIGVDISGGCLANMSPELIYDPKNKCTYCYAYQNGQPFINTLYTINKKTFLEPLVELIGTILETNKLSKNKKPRVNIRFGQTVECFVPDVFRNLEGFEDGLANSLELMLPLHEKYDIRTVIPSKTLVYREEYVRLLKENNTALFASIADDRSEIGMLGHGFTTLVRLDNLLRYAKAGVNSNIYLAVDVGRPKSEWNEYANYAWDFFHEHKDILTALQILDIRITNKDDAIRFGGATWPELKKGSIGMFDGSEIGQWRLTGNGYLASSKMHSSTRQLIHDSGRQIGACYTHASKKSAKICSGCSMYVKTRTE